jgi:O-antigen/teichoic acid export membrane protein
MHLLNVSRTRINVLANFIGSGWSAVMSLAFVPLYIRFMGVEAYGLVGVFTTLQALASLLDMGMSATLSREIARLSAQSGDSLEMPNLVRTMEVIGWTVAAVIGLAVVTLAPLLAHHWMQSRRLAPEVVQHALMIMGLAMAVHWPFGVYSGGLLGLQRQVMLNVITAGIATLRGAGAVIILWQLSPTVQAFFTWQIAMSLLQTLMGALALWRSVPGRASRAKFQKNVLFGVWRFAAGMSGITVTTVVLTQIDKIILSKLLTLEMFGYYILASTVATSLYRLTAPVFSAIYPRFTQLATIGDDDKLKELYHHSCQLVSVLVLPLAMVMALFSRELLLLWTQNAVTVEHAHLVLTLLACGTALNGLMGLPYALQLAHGWTQLTLRANVLSVIILVPLYFHLTASHGAPGAAAVWVLLNSGYVMIMIPFMHRRLLPGEQWRWYWSDVAAPLVPAAAIALLGRFWVHQAMSPAHLFTSLAGILMVMMTASFLTTSRARAWLFGR